VVQTQVRWGDAAYFAPLSNLRLGSDTEVYFGLVHLADGVAGARQRIASAKRVVPRFGVASECGLGWHDAQTLIPLLELYRQVCSGALTVPQLPA
jgi:hypothetical protein